MDESYFKKVILLIFVGGLLVLSYLLLKPIILSIIFGIILAFVFSPVYNWVHKGIKNRNLSALLICFIFLLIIIIPIIFLTPILIEQSIKLYLAVQQLDFVTPLKTIFPSLFTSSQISLLVAGNIHNFITSATSSLTNSLSNVISDAPTFILQFIVILFTLFYFVRDKEEIVTYIKSVLPFSTEIENKLFRTSKDVTSSVIFGMIIIGTLQGIIVGIGFFVFGVPNALLLMLFAVLAGVLPIIGPAIIWVPVMIYLLIAGNDVAAIGMIVFGLLSHIPDYLVRPLYLSKRTNLNPAIALIGMIGGLFMFGVLGVILGPLIISYLIVIMDLFKKKI
ncbi:MAG TPA: AI-2E family transporter [Patescibacteria group bacterium]|nr:AI-2E family transporter [Patescibacteria group bacterium]